jgi:hypothetical protein
MVDRVRLKWDKERGVGTVVTAGPDQTAVRWSGYGERIHLNSDLINVKEDGTIHLHENWRELKSFAENTKLIALCGAKKLQRWQFEFKRGRATCADCLARASHVKLARVISGKEKKKARGLLSFSPDHIIKVLVKTNPFKGAKGLRFEKIKEFNGKSVQEFIADGGNIEALSNRVKDKMVEVND